MADQGSAESSYTMGYSFSIDAMRIEMPRTCCHISGRAFASSTSAAGPAPYRSASPGR